MQLSRVYTNRTHIQSNRAITILSKDGPLTLTKEDGKMVLKDKHTSKNGEITILSKDGPLTLTKEDGKLVLKKK